MLALLALQNPSGAAEITGDHRLIRRFVEDGAITQKAWFAAATDYDHHDGGHDVWVLATAAFRLGRDVETGIQGGLLDRKRETGETLFGADLAEPVDTTGLADATIYGKYRLLRSPVEMAIGAEATLPLAGASTGRGPGAFRYAAFVGLRRSFSGATLIGSVGATDSSDSKGAGGTRGRSAALLGAGLLLPLSYVWTLVGEVTYDGARYEGSGSDARALVGLDWRPTENIVIRGGVARGISEAAPDWSADLSAAFHF